MTEEEKARYYLRQMYESRPKNFVREVDGKSRGLQMILVYLSESTGEICAGDLSKEFGVSTARIAVAIRNLLHKGFIETATSATDKRKVVVKITDAGRAEVEKSIQEMVCLFKFLLRELGEDDLASFLRIFAKVNALLDKTPKCEERAQEHIYENTVSKA